MDSALRQESGRCIYLQPQDPFSDLVPCRGVGDVFPRQQCNPRICWLAKGARIMKSKDELEGNGVPMEDNK